MTAARPFATTSDLTAVIWRSAGALLVLAVAWYQASERLRLADQLPWLALAGAGLIGGAAAQAMWILEARRAIRDRYERLDLRLGALVGAADMTTDSQSTETLVVLSTHAGRYYHRSFCDLVAGRPVEVGDDAGHLISGRVPCRVCRP